MNTKTYTLYILECENGSYYTGYTTNLKRRFKEHCEGSSKSKYTRAFPPKRIAQHWEFSCTLSTILKLEHTVKSLKREQKKSLIDKPDILVPFDE